MSSAKVSEAVKDKLIVSSALANVALTDEEKKKLRIQEQLNEIRRMKQAKQGGATTENRGSVLYFILNCAR